MEGGTTVTVSGSGFVRPTEVFVGGQPIAVDPWRSGEELRFETPDVSDLGILGAVDVEIRNRNGVITLSGAFNYYDRVQLDAILPAQGSTRGGERLRIEGAGFDESLVVAFGDSLAAEVEVIDASAANVVTPRGLPGPVDVRVFTDNGRAVLSGGYTYVAPVELNSLSPYAGPLEGGTVIILVGGGSGDTRVLIGGVDAAIFGVSEDGTLITASTPRADEPGARDVRVIGAGGDAVLLGGFSYFDSDDHRLAIYSVLPSRGSVAGGEEVAVVGANFDATTRVAFGPTLADCLPDAVHTLRCITPEADGPGFVDVTVESPRAQATLRRGYQYRPALRITAIAPSSGTTAGGTRVTVRGVGFDADTELRIGVQEAVDVRVLDPTTLVASTPPGAAGPADVAVRRADGVQAIAEGAFSYTGQLRLLAVLPDEGALAGGTMVSVLGTGFVPGTTITFGGRLATQVEVAHGAALTCLTPAGAVGTVDVAVSIPNGERATIVDGYTYFNPSTRFGGTWGDPVIGNVNLTVLEYGSPDPVEDAFCVLGTERGGDHEGQTDARGQVTFAGDDLAGRQQMNCCKEGFSCASIVRYDAENATVYLVRHLPPPPQEGEGEGEVELPPASVSGTVWGIDKFIKPRADPENGWIAVAYVETTTETPYFDARPDRGPGGTLNDDGPYEITARLGDLAVVAIGGILHVESGEFVPIRMGAVRWLFGISGERIEGADIHLNIPMDSIAGLRLDSPPLAIDDPPDWMVVEPTIVLDADGAYPLWQYINVVGEPLEGGIEMSSMPRLANAFNDATFMFRTHYGTCDRCDLDPRSISVTDPSTETFVREVASLEHEVDITPILGLPRHIDPARAFPAQPREITSDRLEWEIAGGSDLPTGQNVALYAPARGRYELFWDIYLRGDATEVVLPPLGDIHGFGANANSPTRVYVAIRATYVDGFDLDGFEYGDLGVANRRALGYSLDWIDYVAGE